MRQVFPILLAILTAGQISAQTTSDSILIDSTVSEVIFNSSSAWIYVDKASRNSELWRAGSDSVADAMQRLLVHSQDPLDSALHFLKTMDLSRIPVYSGLPVLLDSIELVWINDSTFAIDPQGWNTNLYINEEESYVYPVDFSTLTLSEALLDESGMLDTTLFIADTVLVSVVDTAAARTLEISIHTYSNGTISPPILDPSSGWSAELSDDRSWVNYYVPGTTWIADEDSPFLILSGEHQLDSLQKAITTLLDYTEERDSTLLLINDMYGEKIPYWVTSGKDNSFRLWVKNYNNDSITLWVGNPGTKEISLLLEDDVSFSRLIREEILHLPSFIEPPERTLHKMKLLEPEPIYWDYELSNLLSISQTYLANWTKGGESSFATIIDVMGRATYNNKEAKTQLINVARIKFGTIMTKEAGFSKNNDQFEIDSRYIRNAWGKFGMSASFYMKNQMARGYNYPNDSVIISKFLNPGTITIGLGAEYKPLEKTSINIAPLSYKTTFVLDTAVIDQTKHGIDKDKVARRELGLQIAASNEISPFKDLTMINRVRLFSSYLNKPQNVDVDWELILEQKISWFFSIRLDLHLIYDDDVRFPVLDDNGNEIQLPDGSKKEVAKAQFKEFLGLTLSFKL